MGAVPNLSGSSVDTIMASAFPPDGPGATVIVTVNGNVAVRKAYGLANLETKTPMRPEMVFELGSVTKQFTSTAILMLAEQHKLALDDDLRKFVPEFPDKQVKITIDHLLTHTSGVKDYTDDPKWPDLWRQDLTPLQVVNLVKDAPLDFAPGTDWKYDNTGYTLLGMIIEKASGQRYEDFIRQNIFQPLGMTHSYYGSFTAVIPNRASGYTKGSGGWENAPYLSMAQPYAAGALMSNVDDLALWDAAVSAGKLISAASWKRAFTGYRLANGEDSRYGYGWELGSYDGHPIVHHGGGIPGYNTEVLRMPDDHVYVAVLTNSDSPPIDVDSVAARIAAAAIGRPYRDPAALTLDPEILDTFVGVYQIGADQARTIRREGARMFMQRTGGPKVEIFPSAIGEFYRKDSFQRLSFVKDSTGAVVKVISRVLDGTPDIGIRKVH
jgi:CubicO group peptidase (beta-lactamase class C family)